MYTYACICRNTSRYEPHKSCTRVFVCGLQGELASEAAWQEYRNQLSKNTEPSSPVYCIFPPKYTHTKTYMHTHLWTAPLTLSSPGACPNAGLSGRDHSSDWNSCHSVMAYSRDTFRPQTLSPKAPAALSHPQRPAMTSPRPGTVFPPSA